MRRFIFIIVVLGALPLVAGETLDEVVVTVNGNVLLQSDWDAEVRYEAFMTGRPLSETSAQQRETALNRIIDQELLREQMRGPEFKSAAVADVDDQIKLLQSQYVNEHGGESWSSGLSKYGLSQEEIRERVQAELDQLRFVDQKLRPSVEVAPDEVEAYYKEKMADPNSAQFSEAPKDIREKIRAILIQQKINTLLDTWLESLRAQAQIHRVVTNAEAK